MAMPQNVIPVKTETYFSEVLLNNLFSPNSKNFRSILQREIEKVNHTNVVFKKMTPRLVGCHL